MDHKQSKDYALLLARAADDKQADSIIIKDVHEYTPFADMLVIVSADNERKVKAVSDGAQRAMRDKGIHVVRSEGEDTYRWVVLDFSGVTLHVFHDDDRAYYQLDKLWDFCPTVPFHTQPYGDTMNESARDEG